MPHQPFYRKRPLLVRQRRGLSCWAAALASWMSVACPSAGIDENWALETFRRWQWAGHRIEWPGLKEIATRLGMHWEETGPGALTPEYFSTRLAGGHLWLTYVPSPGLVAGHTVVVYGVSDVAVDLMDPYEGYTSKPHEFFVSRTQAFVGWPPPTGCVLDPRQPIS